MEALGLVFGAIDLIVTPGNEYVFLEVNPAGQFLWIDSQTGLPLVDALSEMLLQGRPDYSSHSQFPAVQFDAEFEQAVERRQLKAMAGHVCDLRS